MTFQKLPKLATSALQTVAGDRAIAHLPEATWPTPQLPALPPPPFLAAWLPSLSLPLATAQSQPAAVAWLASADLQPAIAGALARGVPASLLAIAEALEGEAIAFRWYGLGDLTPGFTPRRSGEDFTPSSAPCRSGETLTASSRVLALVPHYRCEPWLRRCLRSLVSQTRPPDGIAVIDDASPQPPLSIVQEFPSVTLLAAARNVGPYRLVQQVIDSTDYDAYLFQDADDWSSGDRLARLLAAAAQTGAELLGGQMLEVGPAGDRLTPICFPERVNQAVARQPGHPLAHPTSLVSRALVQRLGGFATGLRFGGDTEFVLRAVWQTQVLNLPAFTYLRYRRPASLSTAPATGLDSPARAALIAELKALARDRAQAAQQGRPPALQPLCVAGPIPLQHLTGPRLAGWTPCV